MAGFTVHVEGLQALDAKLNAMGQDEARRCIRKALKAGAVIIQEAVQARAPVRPDLPSSTALPPGAMASDIEIHNIVVGDNLAATIGPGKHTSRQAVFVEYGHARRGGHVPAHPFIRPAYEASCQPATTELVNTLATEIEKSSSGKQS